MENNNMYVQNAETLIMKAINFRQPAETLQESSMYKTKIHDHFLLALRIHRII